MGSVRHRPERSGEPVRFRSTRLRVSALARPGGRFRMHLYLKKLEEFIMSEHRPELSARRQFLGEVGSGAVGCTRCGSFIG